MDDGFFSIAAVGPRIHADVSIVAVTMPFLLGYYLGEVAPSLIVSQVVLLFNAVNVIFAENLAYLTFSETLQLFVFPCIMGAFSAVPARGLSRDLAAYPRRTGKHYDYVLLALTILFLYVSAAATDIDSAFTNRFVWYFFALFSLVSLFATLAIISMKSFQALQTDRLQPKRLLVWTSLPQAMLKDRSIWVFLICCLFMAEWLFFESLGTILLWRYAVFAGTCLVLAVWIHFGVQSRSAPKNE